MPFQETLTYDEVAEKLSYDPTIGVFMWLADVSKNVKAGSRAGAVKATRINAAGKEVSYLYIRLMGRNMPGARLAWLLYYKRWPEGRIVPKNGNTLDLRIENLAESNGLPASYDFRDPEQRKQYHRDYRATHPLASKGVDLTRRFGVSMQIYLRMIALQGNKCAVCQQEETVMRGDEVKSLAVDHCHATGAIRELLCQNCNQMIGFSKDDPAKLRAAADYIEKHVALADNVVALTKKDA